MTLYELEDGNRIVAEQDFIDSVYPGAKKVEASVPSKNSAILQQLEEIDALALKPRTLRETALGNVTYLAELEKKAVALRAQLKE